MSQEFWIRGEEDEGGGQAAQTGNLVHSGAAEFHRTKSKEAGLIALDQAREKFPKGDPKRAKKHYEAYVADLENQKAEVVKVEQKITCVLDPAPWDDTHEPIIIRGTLDQLKWRDGVLTVDDIKTGAMFYGQVALDHYRTQQAAYTLGAYQTWKDEFPGVQFDCGALICTEGYFKPRPQVFFYHDWTIDDVKEILQPIVVQVAAARMGFINLQPRTDVCRWCDYKKASNCRAQHKELRS